jgi:hypothetical protein
LQTREVVEALKTSHFTGITPLAALILIGEYLKRVVSGSDDVEWIFIFLDLIVCLITVFVRSTAK